LTTGRRNYPELAVGRPELLFFTARLLQSERDLLPVWAHGHTGHGLDGDHLFGSHSLGGQQYRSCEQNRRNQSDRA
jgi:hypothetical protein